MRGGGGGGGGENNARGILNTGMTDVSDLHTVLPIYVPPASPYCRQAATSNRLYRVYCRRLTVLQTGRNFKPAVPRVLP